MIRDFTIAEFWVIAAGLRATLLLSAIAFVGGGLGGLGVALARTAPIRWLRVAAGVFIDLFQGTPMLLQLFLVFYGLPVFGIKVNIWIAAALGLTLHASAFLGEIWRGGIQAVPRGQMEAAEVLGLGYVTRMRHVILPQALRMSFAPTVGFLVQLIKGTSLAAIVGFVELTRAGSIVSNQTFKPLIVFAIVGALYFVLCWPLSLFGARLENRLAAATAR